MNAAAESLTVQKSKHRRLKLIVSDLHLGVGLQLQDGTLNPLEEFYFDQKFAEFIGHYTSGQFADCEVELIFNGDIFNFLQIDYHGHYVSVITESMTLNKLERIVEGHPVFFESLKKFVSQGHKITYIVGNHDQEILWPRVREYLNTVIGHRIQYENLVYFFDGVHVEHGHMHEAANRMNPKKFFLRKDIPEPILNLPFGSHFFVECVLRLKLRYPHVDKARPFGKALRWMLVNEPVFFVKSTFKVLGYMLRSMFVSNNPRKAWGFREVFKIMMECAVFPDLTQGAAKILKDERVHTVVFGHNHVYKYKLWADGKQYFNSGTWTDLTSLDINSLGKITKLTYVLLEYPHESRKPLARLKEWKGYHRIEEEVAIT